MTTIAMSVQDRTFQQPLVYSARFVHQVVFRSMCDLYQGIAESNSSLLGMLYTLVTRTGHNQEHCVEQPDVKGMMCTVRHTPGPEHKPDIVQQRQLGYLPDLGCVCSMPHGLH